MDMTVINFDKDKYHLQGVMINWCNEYIGENSGVSNDWVWTKPVSWEGMGKWAIMSMFGNTFFYFRDSKDALLFMLRWCEQDGN